MSYVVFGEDRSVSRGCIVVRRESARETAGRPSAAHGCVPHSMLPTSQALPPDGTGSDTRFHRESALRLRPVRRAVSKCGHASILLLSSRPEQRERKRHIHRSCVARRRPKLLLKFRFTNSARPVGRWHATPGHARKELVCRTAFRECASRLRTQRRPAGRGSGTETFPANVVFFAPAAASNQNAIQPGPLPSQPGPGSGVDSCHGFLGGAGRGAGG